MGNYPEAGEYWLGFHKALTLPKQLTLRRQRIFATEYTEYTEYTDIFTGLMQVVFKA